MLFEWGKCTIVLCVCTGHSTTGTCAMACVILSGIGVCEWDSGETCCSEEEWTAAVRSLKRMVVVVI